MLSAVLMYFTFILFSDSKFDSLSPVHQGPLYLKNSQSYSTEYKGAMCLVAQLEKTKCAICMGIRAKRFYMNTHSTF